MELRFTDHPIVRSATLTARANGDGLIHLRIAVENGSDWAIDRVDFPQFAAPARLGNDIADDRLLFPFSDGSLLESPGALTQSRKADYPGWACVQLMAFYDTHAGLYLATHDPDGHCKEFGVISVKDRSLEIPITHRMPAIVGRDVELPYDVVLGMFHGDWRDAADIYKRWAKTQRWCAKTLRERADIPSFLKERAGVIIAGIQNSQGYNGIFGQALEKLPDLPRHIAAVPGWHT